MNKKIQSFTLPLIASNLFQIIIAQVSLAIISRRSTEALAAIALIDGFLYAFAGILGAIGLAFNIYGAKAVGQREETQLNDYLSSVLFLVVAIGVSFFLIFLLFGRGILQVVYGFSGELLRTATLYLAIMSPYILLTLVTFVFTSLLKIEKKTNYILGVSIISALVQVLLSYLLINGNLGFPAMGVLGSGIANMLATLCLLGIYGVLLRGSLARGLKQRPRKRTFLLKKAVPLMIQECFEGLVFIIAFEAFVSRLGVSTLAAYAIGSQGLMIARLPALMYGNAVTVFASEANGQKNRQKILAVGKSAFVSSFVAYVGIASLIWVFRPAFFQLFTTDVAVLDLLPAILPIMLGIMLVSPLYEITKYLLQSLECSRTVCVLTGCVNSLVLVGIMVFWSSGQLNFFFLYCLYGMNFLILGSFFAGLFYWTIKQRDPQGKGSL
ncbi:MATE family efflux transporter [Enterococcus casseliflavus]|uniref:MATE family efflux transporter n=1 Tax=Enterococcus casseliflavus TaxID=37734 RepID=UPI0039A4B791